MTGLRRCPTDGNADSAAHEPADHDEHELPDQVPDELPDGFPDDCRPLVLPYVPRQLLQLL